MDQPVRRKVAIVDAGHAGARCAGRLAVACDVTMIGAEPTHPFSRVALSLLLAGKMGAAVLVAHPSKSAA